MVLLSRRAAEAERFVLKRFVGPWLGIPGTRLGRATSPSAEAVASGAMRHDPFHYWWQAHLLDAIVDGGLRRLSHGDRAGARASARLGHRVLATIRLRNGGRLRNRFYDDMAWLALAVGRLAALDRQLRLTACRLSLSPARATLTRQLLQGRDDTGGVVWNKDRDFLNVPAAGPVALHLSRSGHRDAARTIVEWVMRHLAGTDRGLILDGVRRDGSIVADLYTYNQGTVLAAMLELGEPRDLARAAALVHAVGEHLTQPGTRSRVLVTHGAGDGGLFTGILVRHLADAACQPQLDGAARSVAAALVRDTAEGLWEGRDAAAGWFPTTAAAPAGEERGVGGPVELSTQLQAWMVLEAAARLGDAPTDSAGADAPE